MQQKDILEGNKLIAGIDGWVRTTKSDALQEVYSKDGRTILLSDLNYHENWSLLMPVVEKIESLNNPFDVYYNNVEITQGYVKVHGTKGKIILYNTTMEGSKIKAVYKAVIDFIKWYNQQTTNG